MSMSPIGAAVGGRSPCGSAAPRAPCPGRTWRGSRIRIRGSRAATRYCPGTHAQAVEPVSDTRRVSHAGTCPAGERASMGRATPLGVSSQRPTVTPAIRLAERPGLRRVCHRENRREWIPLDRATDCPCLTFERRGHQAVRSPGPKLLEDEHGADTQDLLLQNHDVFFVDTARDMCEFTRAGVVDGDYEPYPRDHPITRRILDEMAEAEESVLTGRIREPAGAGRPVDPVETGHRRPWPGRLRGKPRLQPLARSRGAPARGQHCRSTQGRRVPSLGPATPRRERRPRDRTRPRPPCPPGATRTPPVH